VSVPARRRPAAVLAVEGLSRDFGSVRAVDDLSLEVGEGEIVGLVGRNGAGKTTTMRAIMGIVEPDAGRVTWRGRPVEMHDRLRFGYMPEERGLYPQMQILDQVAYFGTLHGLGAKDARERASEWLTRLGVVGRDSDKLVALSHGNQQRVQLAVSLVHDPDLLVLDEPFSGLDPSGVDELSRTLREVAAHGTAVLFSSHQLDLVSRMCDRVVIVEAGRVLAEGTLDDLRARFPRRLRVEVDAKRGWEKAVKGVTVLDVDAEGVLFLLDEATDPQSVLAAAQKVGSVEHFGFEDESLSEMYLELVRA
jgi:ABC-2 type transport system ATP-binding protein